MLIVRMCIAVMPCLIIQDHSKNLEKYIIPKSKQTNSCIKERRKSAITITMGKGNFFFRGDHEDE